MDLARVHAGLCQVFDGHYNLFDLKLMDEIGMSEGGSGPATADLGSGTFLYRMCGLQWSLTAQHLGVDQVPASCADMYSANAFYMVGGECKYSFDEITMTGIVEGEESKGFKLEFESEERCEQGQSDDDHFVFELQALCQAGDPGSGAFTLSSQADCRVIAAYKGPEGCKLYEAPVDDALELLAPAFGGVLIVLGLLLAFAGSKFLFAVFAIAAFLLVGTCAFMYSYNFLPKA